MAQPLIVLSAIAASSQIAGQIITASCAIHDLYRKIHDAPSTVRRQILHLEHLTSISRLIIQNPGLQTDSVAAVLGDCLCEIQELRQLLDKSLTHEGSHTAVRIHKMIAALMNDKRVEAVFRRLERDKVSLALCIQEVDS